MNDRVARDTVLYTVSSLIVRATGIITLPITSRLLTPEDYGSIAYVSMWSVLVATLLGFGHETTLVRFYLGHDDRAARRNVAVTWLAWTLWGSALALCAAAAMLRLLPAAWVPFTERQLPLLLLAAASIPFQAIITLCGQVLRAEQRALEYAVLSSASAFLSVALAVYFLAGLQLGPNGVFLGSLAGALVMAPIALYVTGLSPAARPDLKRLPPMMAFGLPIAISSMMYFATATADRFMLEWLGTTEALGLITVAGSLSSILNVYIQSFYNAWVPRAIEAYEKDPGGTAGGAVSSGHVYLYLLGGAVVCLAGFSRPVITVMSGPSFHEAWRVLPLLAFATLVHGMLPLATLGIQLSKQTSYTLIGAALALPINLACAYLLIPAWGMYGAAMALLAGNVCQVAFSFVVSSRVSPIRFSYRQVGKIAAISGAGCAGSYLSPAGVAGYMSVGIGLLLAYGIAGVSLKLIRIEDARRQLAMLRSAAAEPAPHEKPDRLVSGFGAANMPESRSSNTRA